MSTIKTETLSTPSNATVPVDTVVNGTAKAWVNFNGTGTVAIRRAFNVSSITDLGTGLYRANFTNAMPDASYAALVGANVNDSNNDVRRNCRVVTWASGTVTVVTGYNSASDSKEDFQFTTITVFS